MFTFQDWLFSNYSANEPLNGRYGLVHFAVLAACVALILLLSVWGRRCPRARRPIITVLICFILTFELARRGILIAKVDGLGLKDYLWILLPRPWCAISCWLLIFSLFIRTKSMYNLCSMNALICAIVFFAYPEVGFIHKYYFFENVYSIATHALLLISSILLIVYGFTDFRYFRKRWSFALWDLLGLGAIFAYALAISPMGLGIEPDPMYFLPGDTNAVMRVLGLDYPIYIAVYVGFLLVYFNLYYFIQYIVTPGRTGINYHVPMGKQTVRLLFTLGIWWPVWIFKTTRYTNRAEELPRRHPFGKLMLCLFIPFYWFYWVYQTARRIDLLAEKQGIRSDLTAPCLFTAVFLPILPPIIMQEMINETVLAEAAFEKAKAEAFAKEEAPCCPCTDEQTEPACDCTVDVPALQEEAAEPTLATMPEMIEAIPEIEEPTIPVPPSNLPGTLSEE